MFYFYIEFIIRVVRFLGQYKDFFNLRLLDLELTQAYYMTTQSVKNIRMNIPINELWAQSRNNMTRGLVLPVMTAVKSSCGPSSTQVAKADRGQLSMSGWPVKSESEEPQGSICIATITLLSSVPGWWNRTEKHLLILYNNVAPLWLYCNPAKSYFKRWFCIYLMDYIDCFSGAFKQ